ncbi:MAG: ribose 1,5-bisphosphate isomerase [Euryarchaeota archaeon]|nr:ribose 1,5-bisphosphate isomerase [Euryarchaeota archaeon]
MTCDEVRETAERIFTMDIRGAAKIGRSAAAALKACAQGSTAATREAFIKEMEEAARALTEARPSAVSLPNAVRFVVNRARTCPSEDVAGLKEEVAAAADEFIENSLKAMERISRIGARRLSDGDTVMTHCNSSLALGIIKEAWRQGKDIRVMAPEARPRYQGHITARELAGEGIPVTLLVDSAVRTFMKEVDKVIVGADSVAANGAVINKIGTSQLALAAHEARVVFMVAAETYKFHPETMVGELVEIEERDPAEVAQPEDFPGVEIRNPAFDVTPPEYIDLIITEKGVIPPQAAITIIKEEFGWLLSDSLE